ncbi:hypothetical protein GCM10023143_09730 [Compostibacter hankyongensis]|uniref:Uncharacterized protein n=1 Tax=Compostibacter hankyongensis TaxID=1007089 RepID=A0ABP8FJ18_9BACT
MHRIGNGIELFLNGVAELRFTETAKTLCERRKPETRNFKPETGTSFISDRSTLDLKL